MVEGRDPGGGKALGTGLSPQGVGGAPALADQPRRLVERHSAGERGDELELPRRLPAPGPGGGFDRREVKEIGQAHDGNIARTAPAVKPLCREETGKIGVWEIGVWHRISGAFGLPPGSVPAPAGRVQPRLN